MYRASSGTCVSFSLPPLFRQCEEVKDDVLTFFLDVSMSAAVNGPYSRGAPCAVREEAGAEPPRRGWIARFARLHRSFPRYCLQPVRPSFLSPPFPTSLPRAADTLTHRSQTHSYLGFDFPSRKIRLIGTGNTPISLTARPDIARFLSHYLSTLTPSALPSPGEPTILRLEGDRKTFREGVALYASVNSLDPSSFEYSTVSLDEADKIAKDVQADFGRSLVSWLLASWERGARVDQGKGEGVLSGNDWEEWRPVKLEEHFRKQKEEKEKA